jgi:metal-responsive CopG/Arc/MetJ family transcriptional regulator
MARGMLSVSLDFSLAERVRQMAQRSGLKESHIVAEALRRFFEENTKSAEQGKAENKRQA